ncbi:hypothetical protein ANTRET_LOCUS2409 [Anthophora retusa]
MSAFRVRALRSSVATRVYRGVVDQYRGSARSVLIAQSSPFGILVKHFANCLSTTWLIAYKTKRDHVEYSNAELAVFMDRETSSQRNCKRDETL